MTRCSESLHSLPQQLRSLFSFHGDALLLPGSVTYRYFPCLSRLFRTFPRPSGPPPNLPHLSRTSRTPSDPFLVFHRLPLPPTRFWTTSTGSTGFHWLPHASAPSRGAIAMCLGAMARNSRGPFRPKRHLIVPLCLGTLFLVIIVFIVLSLSHCSSLLLFVYYYI